MVKEIMTTLSQIEGAGRPANRIIINIAILYHTGQALFQANN
jgi:hypothetical protein